MVAVVILCAIALVAALAIAWLMHDMRKLHRSGKQLTGAPGDVNGVSPAGATYFGNQLSH